TAELEDSERHLAEALGTYEDVQAFRAAVEPARRLVGQLVEQTGEVATALATHETARQRVTEALAASATDQHPAFADITEVPEHVLASEVCAEHERLIRQWTTEKDRLEEKAGQAAVKAGLKLLD